MRFRNLFFALFLGLATAGLAACDNDGPAENAGEAVDDAAERAGEAIENTGEAIQRNVQ